jgi:TIR domain/SIR2-like domain
MPPELPWRKLIESIKRGNCILLLGPEASLDPTDTANLPLTHKLANHLADHPTLSDNKDLVNRNDIAHVAQLFKQQQDRMDLEMAVGEFYAAYKELTTDFHKCLAELPFTLCINTTLDNFFSNALLHEDIGKSCVCDYYNFNRGLPSNFIQPTIDKPYIYNLYGSCNDLESLVLTEDELLDFLVNVIKGSPELPPFIRSQFANKDLNFLFVGFGFHSWHNRILLHTLNAHNHSIQSLAIESKSFFVHPDSTQTAVFYTLNHKIKFEQLSWLDFASQLRDTYNQSVSKAPVPQALPENAPKVFLCYASEDRDQVEQLSLQLQTAGIEPWQDKQNLRAGDNWDSLLVHVIENFIDYFIVVQTPAMTGQVKGYFHKEIARALDQEEYFGGRYRFILPVMYSDQEILKNLKKLHAIRLDLENGFQQLTDAIKTDWQQRPKKGAS